MFPLSCKDPEWWRHMSPRLHRVDLLFQWCRWDTKQSRPEDWGMWITSLSLLLPGPLWVLVAVRVQSMDQIELFNNQKYLKPFNCKQVINTKYYYYY